jgi:hypothetical protein
MYDGIAGRIKDPSRLAPSDDQSASAGGSGWVVSVGRGVGETTDPAFGCAL